MYIHSLFIGNPKAYSQGTNEVITSIFREKVQTLQILNNKLINNKQADYKYHGGTYKEVYSYALEDYDYWKEILKSDFEQGCMGENITTVGIDENKVYIGDQFQFGGATLEVAGPRTPCSKLNLRLGRNDAIKLFLKSKKSGIYFKVINDGKIKVNDSIIYLGRSNNLPEIKLRDLAQSMATKASEEIKERVLKYPDLDPAIIKKILK